MIHLNEIPLDYELRRKILPQLPAYPKEPEMSEFDSAFLCGALKTFRPKKILEVGVAGGATTAIILQTLENLGERYEMYSVDLYQNFFINSTMTTGFLGTFAKENVFGNLRGDHKFHLGKILPQVIDEIGSKIDFVILDTIHHLPGELLDFLAVLPYLTDDAVIVLHDISLHFYNNVINNAAGIYQHGGDPFSIATGVLFGAVTAEKFLNFQSDEYLFRYPNIAAFKINEQTAENVENVFLALALRWDYFPENQLDAYRRHYQRFYADALVEIFQEAIDMNGCRFALSQNG